MLPRLVQRSRADRGNDRNCQPVRDRARRAADGHRLLLVDGNFSGVDEIDSAEGAQAADGEPAPQRRCNVAHASPSKICTLTGSPAATAPRSCSSTIKQLASAIERSTPDPCCPVMRTFHSPFSWNTTPRWYSVRPATLRILSAAVAFNKGTAKSSDRPERWSRASRTNW